MKRITSNLLAIIGSDAARRALGFLTLTYLARTITTADFGAINIGFAILSYALILSSGGMSTFGAKEVARGASDEFVNSMMGLRIAAAVIVFCALASVTLLSISNEAVSKMVVIFSFSLFAQALLLDWFFQGKEEMIFVGAGKFASAAVYSALAIGFVKSSSDVQIVAVAAVAGDLVAAGLLLRFYRKGKRNLRIRLNAGEWKTSIKKSLPLGWGSLLAQFSVNLAPLVIGIVLTNADAGIYSAASKLVFFILMLDRVLGTLLLPATARLHATSPEAVSAALSNALRWVLVLALPLTVGGTLLAGPLMVLVFGIQYQASTVVFQVLIWYFLFTMIHTIYTSGMISVGKEGEYGRVMMLSGLIYTISIIVCTKLYGTVGAAAAVAGSEAVTLVLMRNAFHRTMTTSVPGALPFILLSTLLMGVVLLLLPSMHVVLMVAIGFAVYAVLMALTRTVSLPEIRALVRRL